MEIRVRANNFKFPVSNFQKTLTFHIRPPTFAAASAKFFSFIKVFSVMLKGTVKFFNETKGFGFIVDSASGQEIFVHVSGLVDKIREGDTVTFETKQGTKGMNAVNVQIA